MPRFEDFGPSWILTAPQFGDSIELYHGNPGPAGYFELHVQVEDAADDCVATIILPKTEATALRDALTRMIEAMP